MLCSISITRAINGTNTHTRTHTYTHTSAHFYAPAQRTNFTRQIRFASITYVHTSARYFIETCTCVIASRVAIIGALHTVVVVVIASPHARAFVHCGHTNTAPKPNKYTDIQSRSPKVVEAATIVFSLRNNHTIHNRRSTTLTYLTRV